MSEYDFHAWLQSQIGFDLSQISDSGFALVTDVELKAKGFRVAEPGFDRSEGTEFAERVKQFLTFLRCEFKPDGVTDSDWQAYRPICQVLVEKQQMKKETLDLFENIDSPEDQAKMSASGY